MGPASLGAAPSLHQRPGPQPLVLGGDWPNPRPSPSLLAPWPRSPPGPVTWRWQRGILAVTKHSPATSGSVVHPESLQDTPAVGPAGPGQAGSPVDRPGIYQPRQTLAFLPPRNLPGNLPNRAISNMLQKRPRHKAAPRRLRPIQLGIGNAGGDGDWDGDWDGDAALVPRALQEREPAQRHSVPANGDPDWWPEAHSCTQTPGGGTCLHRNWTGHAAPHVQHVPHLGGPGPEKR